jgi:AcrR family transcriptional regulator
MAQIAEAAGVAVQKVYFAFHTKAALLSRAYDFAVMGAGAARPAGTALRTRR